MSALVTLAIGLVIGYLGQRSRFCIISGIRDFYLARDAYRLKGLLGVVLGALAGFVAVKAGGGSLGGFPLLSEGLPAAAWVLILVSLAGGFGMAFFSVVAEGCPFRQHVMAGEGRVAGWVYLAGLVGGVILFDIVAAPLLRLANFLN